MARLPTLSPKIALVCLIFAIIAQFSSARAQNLFTNGSFESPALPAAHETVPILGTISIPAVAAYSYTPPMGMPTSQDTTDLPGWSFTGSVTQINNTGTLGSTLGLLSPENGSQYVVLNGLTVNVLALTLGSTGVLSQGISVTANHTYQLSFYYAGVAAALGSGSAQLGLTITNTSSSTAPSTLSVSTTTGYTEEIFNFTALATGTSTLTLNEGSLVNIDGVALDNFVVVQDVPEPSTYLYVALGCAGLWFTIRRRAAAAGLDDETPGVLAAV